MNSHQRTHEREKRVRGEREVSFFPCAPLILAFFVFLHQSFRLFKITSFHFLCLYKFIHIYFFIFSPEGLHGKVWISASTRSQTRKRSYQRRCYIGREKSPTHEGTGRDRKSSGPWHCGSGRRKALCSARLWAIGYRQEKAKICCARNGMEQKGTYYYLYEHMLQQSYNHCSYPSKGVPCKSFKVIFVTSLCKTV